MIKKGFLDWLNTYMDRKPERRSNGLDVDAVHIEELVSRLQAEWELLWLEGHNTQSETVEEIDGVMDVDENWGNKQQLQVFIWDWFFISFYLRNQNKSRKESKHNNNFHCVWSQD